VDISVDADALAGHDVQLVVLFGSQARGRAGPGSDVDVGVLFGRHRGPRAEAAVVDALRATGTVDVVDLSAADPLLLFEVARDGRLLYVARQGGWEEFRIRAVKRYYDTAWIRRIESEALQKRYG
jgi:predicted nucleotidyltransferase